MYLTGKYINEYLATRYVKAMSGYSNRFKAGCREIKEARIELG